MEKMFIKFLVAIAFILIQCEHKEQSNAVPPTPRNIVVDTYHGVSIEDPYQYLENLDNKQVQQWFRAQNDYTRAYLDQIPGRTALLNRIIELDHSMPYTIRELTVVNDYFFYLKRNQGENHYALLFQKGKSGPPQILFDPNLDTVNLSIDYFTPSPNGAYVGIGVSQNGKEFGKLLIYEVANQQVINQLDDVRFARINWMPDESGFSYTFYPHLFHKDANQKFLWRESKWHRLGANFGDDPVLFSSKRYPELPITDIDHCLVNLEFNSEFAIGYLIHGVSRDLTLFYTKRAELLNNNKANWNIICDQFHSIQNFGLFNDQIYLLNKATNQVVTFKLGQQSIDEAKVLVEAKEDQQLMAITVQQNRLIVLAREKGKSKLLIQNLAHEGAFWVPELEGPLAYIYKICPTKNQSSLFVDCRSPINPSAYYKLDLINKTFEPLGMRYQPSNLPAIVLKTIMAESHDGVRIPITVIHKKGLALDGKRPTWLIGYGAYGSISQPIFNTKDLAWYEQGGVLAHAHVRGGGYHGKRWHDAGKLATKKNTWLDFIACAEELVKQGYTNPSKLAGQGTSAGGIMVGMAMVERPDLFSVIISRVGSSNRVRSEQRASGPSNTAEFGTVQDANKFRYLLAMDVYHNLKKGVSYPAAIITCGYNDTRVPAYEPGKFAAMLQYTSSSNLPILLRVDYTGGHKIGSNANSFQHELADRLAFMLSQMNVPIQSHFE